MKDVVVFSNYQQQEQLLTILNPQLFFHLASMTNADECDQYAMDALDANGILACKFADVIHKFKLNTKYIHTSSCELYKGYGTYTVYDDDGCFTPTHPYAYAKCLAHNMLKHYREIKGCWTSNAILWTTESKYRQPSFLLKKISNHIKQWLAGNKYPLQLGSIQHYRNINHAEDVAHGLFLISQQDKPEDYVTCGTNFICIEEAIVQFYEYAGILLIKDENANAFVSGDDFVIQYKQSHRYFDANIDGKAIKLQSIGWKPKHTLQTIFKDLLE